MKMTSFRCFLTFAMTLCGMALCVPRAEAKPKSKSKGKGKEPASKPAVPETPPSSNQIDIISQAGIAMSSVVLAPLDDPAPDVRNDIVQMQQELLDEAAQHPAASPAAYQAANKLCAGWLSAFDERKKRSGSIGQTAPPTKNLARTRKTALHWPDDILTFAREQAGAHAKHRADKQKQSFFDDAAKNNWVSRTAVLRPELDKLYNQFREELRKPAASN